MYSTEAEEFNDLIRMQKLMEERLKKVEQEGIKHDEGKPRVGFMFEQFPLALTEVARVATFGAKKYGEGNWQHVEKERYVDALGRHLLDSGVNDDTGILHKAHVAWNALADLELTLREEVESIQNANGHLIAAAPEMYEALVDLLDICECDNTDAECINRFGFAMEAIKKAEGK